VLSTYEIHEHPDSTLLVVSSTWALNMAVSCKSDPALAKEWGGDSVLLAVILYLALTSEFENGHIYM
jgi:hypothetical protein